MNQINDNQMRKCMENEENINFKETIKENFKNSLDEKIKLKIWIRTLLYTHRLIPKIINIVDKIIYERASSYSFSSNIFNSTKRLENQIDLVIDMSDRKQKLLNIYVMTKKLFEFLPDEYLNVATKKFYENMSNDEIAEELNISVRTVFRKVNDLIEYIYRCITRNNWSLRFVEIQVKGEDWLIERYNKYLNEYIRDSVKSKNMK